MPKTASPEGVQRHALQASRSVEKCLIGDAEFNRNRKKRMVIMDNSSSTHRVLIVDDTKTNIAILVEALREESKLGVATSGAKALEYVEENMPDLILLDIMMPEMDGYEVCARLKAEKKTREIPVIFITAMTEIEDKTKGFELGAVDYITKPFEVVEVRARVQTHLKIEQYRKELEQQNRDLREARSQLQHQVKELEGRDRLVHTQMSVTTSTEACEEILQVVEEVLGCSQAAIYQPNEAGDLLEIKGVLGAEKLDGVVEVDRDGSLVADAFREGGPKKNEAGIAAPLLYRKRVLGLLWIKGMEIGDIDEKEGLQTLWRLAGEGALVLQAARLTEQLESGDWEADELLNLE